MIWIENKHCLLTLSDKACAVSLILKHSGEECIRYPMPMFSVTQDRPFNNEIKLAHPNKRTTYPANSLRREGDVLYVTFETVPIKARIRVTEADEYIALTLLPYEVAKEDYDYLIMDTPPAAEIRLCSLPLRPREKYGEWLNILSDDEGAVCVCAASPCERIDHYDLPDCRILTADVVHALSPEGGTCAIIACKPDCFLSAMAAFEKDHGLPHGANSRQDPLINASVYWTADICPDNVNEHIRYAKQGGFRLMLIYYKAFCKEENGYILNGNYDFNENYPSGYRDLCEVLSALKAAGITPGFHFLHTHIGLKSRYVTPIADHRLGKKQYFTLAKDYQGGDLYVEEDPGTAPRHDGCRVLQFGGELMTYTGYERVRPYRFTGIERCAMGTLPQDHKAGQVGGILDISEFGATSCYIDQMSSLQDEIADKLAAFYRCGFSFCYMDGSEGTNLPYECYIPSAQYKVYKKCIPAPIFTEGAAKSHFSWHFQAGGNAFDIFPPEEFKAAIAKFPAAEAPRMRNDLTRLDFGWWSFVLPGASSPGTQADLYAYGTSKAYAWDCPATIQAKPALFKQHPRTDDILEVMRRWEYAREHKLLSPAEKELLKDTNREFTLLRTSENTYTLAEYHRIDSPVGTTAYLFRHSGQNHVVCWHNSGTGILHLPAIETAFEARKELYHDPVSFSSDIPISGKIYLAFKQDEETIRSAFKTAEIR